MINKKISFNAAKVIMHMKESELKHYSIDLTPIDGMTDHELLIELVKEFKEFKMYVLDVFKRNNLK